MKRISNGPKQAIIEYVEAHELLGRLQRVPGEPGKQDDLIAAGNYLRLLKQNARARLVKSLKKAGLLK